MGLFGNSKNGNAKKNVNVTPSPAAINATGKTLKNAVKNAKTVSEALKVVSKQLNDAASNLSKNAPAIANVTANAVKANAPAAAEALKPMVGGANAEALQNMPKAMIVGGARHVVEQAAKQMKVLSGAARDASNAVEEGLKQLGGVANYVAKNVKNVDLNEVNARVNAAGVGAAAAVNSGVGSNVLPAVSANLNANHVNAVVNVANEVKEAVANKKTPVVGGAKKSKSPKKAVKKTKKNRNVKNSVSVSRRGGYFSMF